MFRLALHCQILIAMVIGTTGGLLVNFWAGDREMPKAVEFPAG